MTQSPSLKYKLSTLCMFRRFSRHSKGVAAVEFALVFPIMIALYLGSVEVSGILQANKSVGKIASSVADLITQQEDVTTNDLLGISEIGEAILLPYKQTQPSIEMIGIRVDNTSPTPKAYVEWSRQYDSGTLSPSHAPGDQITIPARLLVPNTFIVQTTAELRYKPIVTWSTPSGGFINMEETYYLRPRISADVTCSDC